MSLKEMLPGVRTLPRTDKLRLMQFLAAELAQEGSESTQKDERSPEFPLPRACATLESQEAQAACFASLGIVWKQKQSRPACLAW